MRSYNQQKSLIASSDLTGVGVPLERAVRLHKLRYVDDKQHRGQQHGGHGNRNAEVKPQPAYTRAYSHHQAVQGRRLAATMREVNNKKRIVDVDLIFK